MGEEKGEKSGWFSGFIAGNLGTDLFDSDKRVSGSYHWGKLLSGGPFAITALFDEVDESIPDSDECFVATAVYGDPQHPAVEELREFRDEVLVGVPLGRKFVDFYYSGAGRKAAEFVREHAPFLIPAIKTGLDAVVMLYPEKGEYSASVP